MRAISAPGKLRLFPEQRLDHLYQLHRVDAFEWLRGQAGDSIQAVVTDPPYGLLEYNEDQKQKLRAGRGGVWRIPPSYDGCQRRPLPRFTVLNERHKFDLEAFFSRFAALLMPVLVPGAHVFIATNPLVSYLVYGPFIRAGFEKRQKLSASYRHCGAETAPRTRISNSRMCR
jgi:site-specific DNA-methyltransferase (adenine-specific)